jgi:outer membrane receptor protein involved in Fe transport
VLGQSVNDKADCATFGRYLVMVSGELAYKRRVRASKLVRSVLLAAVVAMVVGTTSRGAFADDVADEADLQFQLGAERYEAGDFKGALEHFLVSNRLVPNKNVIFNIARAYEQLKRAPDAYRYYVLALEGETNAQAQKRVQDALTRITPNVAILKVETSPPGATIYLDRRDLGARGNAPRTLGLPESKVKVIVEKPGYEPAESELVDLKLGQERLVHLSLKQILGTVKLEGEAGAQVKVDSEGSSVACTLPCSLDIPPGRHTFFVYKEGFQPGEISADIPANQVTAVRARLATQTGAVVVSSDVRDALISIDGADVGFTPAVLNTPVGKHTITITQQGYRPFVQQIEVTRKQETKIDALLLVSDEVNAASRTTESVEDAPASVSIISQQELRAMGYPTIAEAVRGIRGLYLSDDRSYVTIGFRGFSRPGDYGNRVLVLLDGQPMNDNYIWSSYVGTDGRVDIDDIERIEVVRGPGSVLYGSSAFFGVINLVTRSRNQPTHVEASVGTFEYGLGKGRATSVVRFSPDSGFWATVSGLQGGADREIYYPELNFNPNDPNAVTDAHGKIADGITRGTDRQFAGMFTGRIWWKELTLQWFLNSRKKFLPSGEYGAIFDDPTAHFADTRGMLEARYEPQVTKTVQSLSRAHFNLYNFDGLTPYTPAEGGPNHDSYRGRWGGLEQRFVYNPGSTLRLTVGGEIVRHFTTRQVGTNDAGAYVLDDHGNASRNDPFTVGAGYVNADVSPAKRLKLVAGARFDYYSNLPKFEAWPATNPRLAAIIKPYDGGVLKIMGAKAFRSPSVYELHYTSPFQIAPTRLSPEQIYSGEVEFTHRFTQTVSATGAAYTNYVKNLVVLNDIGNDVVQYQNSPADVVIFGTEVEVRREWRQGWMVGANYSYQHASYTGGGALRDVANSIEHIASVKGAMPIIGRTLMGMTRLTLEGPRPDRNEKPTDPPQEHTDTGVVWDFVLSGEVERLSMRYNLGVYNALDWKYAIIPSGEFRQRQIVQNGRTFLASVTVSF